MKRTITIAALTLSTGLVLAACSDTADNETPATTAPATTVEATETTTATPTTSVEEISGEHDQSDIMFAQMMIPHHEQAVDMSEMLLGKDNIPAEITDFVQGVINAQGPEIDRMNAMLETWGAQPAAMMDMEGMHHGGMNGGMSGMMSAADLAALEAAEGTEAARLYLEQMTAHHEGAVDMAREQVAEGENPQAITLAEQVIEDQEAEITEMAQLLENL